jgi:phage terminase small subunit
VKSNVTPLKKVTQKGTSKSNVTKNDTPKIKLNEMEDLKEKEVLFCLYYIKNFNATSAAIRAGYSAKTASQIGYQLLQKTSVRNEINRLKELKRQSIMISEDDIIERYMRIAFADMTDFVTFGQKDEPVMTMFGPVKDENGKVLTERVNYLDFNDCKKVDGGLICQIKTGRQGMSIKLEDRQKALDWLANFFEMNPMDRHKKWYDQEKLKLERESMNKGQGTNPEDGVQIMDDVG